MSMKLIIQAFIIYIIFVIGIAIISEWLCKIKTSKSESFVSYNYNKQLPSGDPNGPITFNSNTYGVVANPYQGGITYKKYDPSTVFQYESQIIQDAYNKLNTNGLYDLHANHNQTLSQVYQQQSVPMYTLGAGSNSINPSNFVKINKDYTPKPPLVMNIPNKLNYSFVNGYVYETK